MQRKATSIFTLLLFCVFFTSQVFGYERVQQNASLPIPKPTIEYALPYPGILPDNVLYVFKIFRDNVILFFTHDPIKKSNLYLLFADKHIGMGRSLWEKGRRELAGDSFYTGEMDILKSIESLAQFKKSSIPPPGLADKIELALTKHEEVLKEIAFNSTSDLDLKKLSDALELNHQASQQILLMK